MEKRRGRPKISAALRRKPFAMRFSVGELRLFRKAARTEGLLLRKWIRLALIERAAKR